MGDWNSKVGLDTVRDWKRTHGTACNQASNERGHRLLEFAKYNELILANTFGHHSSSRTNTYHSPLGLKHQIDYILVPARYRSGVNVSKTHSFPGADCGSDHDLVLLAFRLKLKKLKKAPYTRLKFDLEKLKDPKVAEDFQACIGGKFAPLLIYDNERTIEETVDIFENTVLEAATQTIGKKRNKKKPWITTDLLDLCDERRLLKKEKDTEEGNRKYKEVHNKIKRGMKRAKEGWIEEQCKQIEESLQCNDSKKAYQIVKNLTTTKQAKVSTVQDKSGKCLMEEQQILDRWTEYCSDLYNYNTQGNPTVLDVNWNGNRNDVERPILREKVESAIKALK